MGRTLSISRGWRGPVRRIIVGSGMNLPNSLTILRIFFVPLLVAALVQENVSVHVGRLLVTNEWLALAIFLAAAATDLLDGYLARRWKQVTTIGTLLDPIADKLLISAALISDRTILRIFFVPLLVAALVQENVSVHVGRLLVTNEWLALAIFLAAAATDLLDGYLARRWKQVTTIGTLLDPIADKLLISAALI